MIRGVRGFGYCFVASSDPSSSDSSQAGLNNDADPVSSAHLQRWPPPAAVATDAAYQRQGFATACLALAAQLTVAKGVLPVSGACWGWEKGEWLRMAGVWLTPPTQNQAR